MALIVRPDSGRKGELPSFNKKTRDLVVAIRITQTPPPLNRCDGTIARERERVPTCSAANVARNQQEDETCQEVQVGSAHGGKARPSTAERARIQRNRWSVGERRAQAWVCLSLACGPLIRKPQMGLRRDRRLEHYIEEGGKPSISVYAGVSFRELWSFLI